MQKERKRKIKEYKKERESWTKKNCKKKLRYTEEKKWTEGKKMPNPNNRKKQNS